MFNLYEPYIDIEKERWNEHIDEMMKEYYQEALNAASHIFRLNVLPEMLKKMAEGRWESDDFCFDIWKMLNLTDLHMYAVLDLEKEFKKELERQAEYAY